ncbi:hypothetical protein RND81_12G200100 [Saponaria officinalis]|uniref:Uncharacterized protein n=1 Tax=Saponaria officinalis TaxID=3572 RepID=A0AAW1GFU3_SAPOF
MGTVLSPLVFFPISTHFTAPPEIPSAPTVLQLGSFHRLSRVEPWDLTADLKSHLQTLYAQSFRITLASSVLPRLLAQKVHDPWAFDLHAALLRQAFAHCGKFPTAASRRSLGRVSVPVWLIILSDQLLIIALVLTRYSPVRHWKHHFPSDLHVLSMPPAFILSQDRTLHEIHSCITYSFLVRRQSGLGIVFHSKA